jgi:hypothetical protein
LSQSRAADYREHHRHAENVQSIGTDSIDLRSLATDSTVAHRFLRLRFAALAVLMKTIESDPIALPWLYTLLRTWRRGQPTRQLQALLGRHGLESVVSA